MYGPAEDIRAAAERYVNNPIQQEMMDDMRSPDAVVAQIRAVLPGASDDDLNLIAGIAAEELAVLRPAPEAAMIDAAAQTFSLEEIEALEAFYSTPLGASVMRKMQAFMAIAMGQVGPEMQAAQQRIGQRVSQAMAGR